MSSTSPIWAARGVVVLAVFAGPAAGVDRGRALPAAAVKAAAEHGVRPTTSPSVPSWRAPL